MRKLAAALVALLMLLLASCASRLPGTPVGAGPGGGTGTEETTGGDLPTTEFPADQVVFQITYGAGYVPEVVWAFVSPALTIYGDGRVYLLEQAGWATAPALQIGTADLDELSDFILGLEQDGLISDSVDFGSPEVTDLGNTSVSIHGLGSAQEISVYALSSSFDEDLSKKEVSNRNDLRNAISSAYDLGQDIADATPETLRALDLGPADGASGPEWTGPALTAFGGSDYSGCAEVTDGVQELYEAAIVNEEAHWDFGTEVRTVAVIPVLPGESAC